ncbi:hypothetical protein DPMN_166553 [Dreissena polymorpha]|uniref:Uncharacterized protein n=1 Tax=Dreissena polymorpha TaxID=45954 RepID=A0A9D4EX29_DREPO|nr:hypothetical protein DPMN_166553 [Dreissena polymorpha]
MSRDEKDQFLMVILSNDFSPRKQRSAAYASHAAQDVQRVVHFLKNTAETIGIFYPAGPRGNDRIPVVFLPSHNTKMGIQNDYKQLCINEGVKYLRVTAFKTIWSRCVSHIKIAKPRDDSSRTQSLKSRNWTLPQQ